MWKQHESVILYIPNEILENDESIQAISGFDLDSTLITSKSARKYILDEYDWIWTFDSVPETLLEIQNKGYTLCIFTNQAKYSNKVLARIESVRSTLESMGIYICIFISTKDDQYRKPNSGMINLLLALLEIPDEDKSDILKKSHYVGDAVGSDSEWPPYRWSSVDSELAENCGFGQFFTPREFFPNQPEPEHKHNIEMIITVGVQGSGKTTFTTKFATQHPEYISLSQDTFGSKIALKKAIIKNLNDGKSVIVDRTNPKILDRQEFIELAKEHGINKVRLWWFSQNGMAFNKLRDKPVPEIAYKIYSKNFEDPSPNEAKCHNITLTIERIN